MDLDLTVIKELLSAYPDLAKVIGWLIVIQTCRKWGAELCCAVSKLCGQINHPAAKWVGKGAWELGLLLSGSRLIPKHIIRSKYNERPRRSRQ